MVSDVTTLCIRVMRLQGAQVEQLMTADYDMCAPSCLMLSLDQALQRPSKPTLHCCVCCLLLLVFMTCMYDNVPKALLMS
jgi:hypothetical protein